MKKLFLIISFFTAIIGQLNGAIQIQGVVRVIDSIETNLPYLQNDQLVEAYSQLTVLYFNQSIPKSEEYALLLLKQSKLVDQKAQIADAYYYLGMCSFINASFQKALSFYDSSLINSRLINDTAMVARAITDKGVANLKLGNIEKAQQYFLYSISLSEKIQCANCLAHSFFEIGNYYKEIGQNTRAKRYLNNAIEYYREVDDNQGIQKALNNLALFEIRSGNYENAKALILESIEIGSLNYDKLNLSNSYMLFGEIYFHDKMLLNAQYFLNQAMARKREVGEESSYINILLGKVYYALGKPLDAKKYFDEALQIAKKHNNIRDELYVYSELYQFNIQQENYELGFEYLKKVTFKKDSMNKNINVGKNLERQIRFESNLVQEEIVARKAIERLDEDKIAVQKKRSGRRQMFFNITISSFILMIVLFMVFIFYFRKRRQLHQKISERNAAIARQRHMIVNQTEALESNNKELEKLSLVARITENAVMVVRPNGTIEWINDGFTRLFGFNLEQIKVEYGDNIFIQNSKYNIKDVLIDCILKKQTLSKVFKFKTKQGKEIWIKSSLTPIYDQYGDLYKIVIVESDISNVKDVEQEILRQKNEIQEQWEEMKSQKDEIESQIAIVSNQKKGIIDSILYARRIQNAVLPQKSFMRKLLKEVMVLHKPKDIVSGDFYWVKEKGDKLVIVIADTILHGVPGALLSLLGILFLDGIIDKTRKIQAANVLDQLNDSIYRSISTSDDVSITNNGMNISLLVYDRKTKNLEYAGANQSIVLVRNKTSIVYKGDAFELGKIAYQNQKFRNSEIKLVDNDMLYLFTDGYEKQFYIESLESDRRNDFLKLLEDISDQPVEQQKKALNLRLRHFYRGVSQVDDALIVGIRF